MHYCINCCHSLTRPSHWQVVQALRSQQVAVPFKSFDILQVVPFSYAVKCTQRLSDWYCELCLVLLEESCKSSVKILRGADEGTTPLTQAWIAGSGSPRGVEKVQPMANISPALCRRGVVGGVWHYSRVPQAGSTQAWDWGSNTGGQVR